MNAEKIAYQSSKIFFSENKIYLPKWKILIVYLNHYSLEKSLKLLTNYDLTAQQLLSRLLCTTY